VSTWGRSSPETEVQVDEPGLRLQRVGGRPPRWRLFAGFLAIVVLVATLWLKPWERPTPTVADLPSPIARTTPTPLVTPGPTLKPTPAPTVIPPIPIPTPRPTADPVALAAQRRQCQSPTSWRMVTAELTATRATRTMYAAVPVVASGATDPSLPLSHLYASGLKAVGVCVPRTPVMSVTAELLQVVLWQVDGQGVVREVARPVIVDGPLFEIGEAYYGPPVDEGGLWPPGRYAFEIRRIAGGASRWMALEFTPTEPNGPVAAAL
jgi:hypothetical protein